MNRRTVIQILLLIILLGASVRVGRCYLVNWMNPDSVSYIEMSKYIASGKTEKAMEIRPEVPPLYITLMALLQKGGITAEYAGTALSLVSGALLILAIFLIGAMVFNEKIGLLAAFIASLQTELVHNSTFILRESLALCFMLFGLYFVMWAVQKNAWWKWFLSGLLIGFCSLTRPDGLEVLLAIPIFLLITFIFCKSERRKILIQSLPGFVILAVAFCLLVFPVQNYFHHHGSIYSVLLNREMLKIYLQI